MFHDAPILLTKICLPTSDNIGATYPKQLLPVESVPHVISIYKGSFGTQFSSVPIVSTFHAHLNEG